jgi:hypothetical protein
MTTPIEQTFHCKYCNHSWNRKYDIEQHYKTKKHTKNELASLENEKSSLENGKSSLGKYETNKIKPEKNIIINYHCDSCQFTCNTKKEVEKHRKSKQHIRNENKEEDFIEIEKKYTCVKCDKCYDIYASCWKHLKTCQDKTENVVMKISEIPTVTQMNVLSNTSGNESEVKLESVIDDENTKKDIIVTIVEKMMDNNKQMIDDNNKHMMEQIVTVVKTILQEIKSQPIITQNNIQNNTLNNTQNNTNNSVTNNHCTMNVFLNEKCKDAMNMFDFITNMNITFDHLYHQADNGFQKGVTKILLDNLMPLSIYNRPIHFTDLKREIMYIKDNDEWTKHEDKEKLIEALEWAAKQGINSFVDWREATSAETESLESPTGQMWMKLMQTVVQPHNERMKAYPKIMKEIARNTHLKKEDQT